MIVPDWAGYLRFRESIRAATDQSLYPIEWLDAQILTGRFRLWVGDHACIIAGIKVYPSGARDVEGIVAAGDASEIERLIPLAEQYGRETGCCGALIESRAGWARVMRKHGYREFQVSIRKAL